MIMNTIYSEAENKFIMDNYGKMTNIELMEQINKKFHKGEKFRNEKSVQERLRRLFRQGKLEKKFVNWGMRKNKMREAYELHKQGLMTLEEAATFCETKRSTISREFRDLRLQELASLSLEKPGARKVALLEKENSALKRELQYQKAVSEIIVETVEKNLLKLPSLTVKPPKFEHKARHKEEIAMLELSDWHAGQKVLSKDVANLNEYNWDEFKRKIDILMQGIYECIEIQRSAIPINKLVINVLGDLITGENLFVGQQRQIDRNLVDQVFEGAEIFASKLFLPLAKLFPTVEIRSVRGNHGRPGKPGEFHERTNWDYVLYRYLATRMRDVTNVKHYISESHAMLYELIEAPRFKHLLIHGNEVRSYMSIPYYGLERTTMKYIQLFGINVNYIHLGHFHSKAIIDIPHGEKIINGSAVGGDDFSINRLQTSSQPKQLLFGFNNKWGKTWLYEIKLGEVKRLQPSEKGIYTPIYEKKEE
jgi:hypothetical protein